MNRAIVLSGAMLAVLLAGCASPGRTPPSPVVPPIAEPEAAPPAELGRAPVPPPDRTASVPADAVESPPADSAAVIAPPKPTWAAQLQSAGCAAASKLSRAEQRQWRHSIVQQAALARYVFEQTEVAGLPLIFALVPFVESGYRVDPGNRGHLSGMWQFSRGTARRFGLRIEPGLDERLSAPRASQAALRHLGEMWRRWGEARLALIGYNAGEHAVTLALRHAEGGAHNALARRLPAHGLRYADRLQRLACALATDPELLDPLRHASALNDRFVHPGTAQRAQLVAVAQLDEAALLRLNPLLGQTRSATLRGQPLLLPEAAQQRLSSVNDWPTPAVETLEHTSQYRVRSGDSLWTIARRHGLTVKQLVRWNGLDSTRPLQVGQRLRLAPSD